MRRWVVLGVAGSKRTRELSAAAAIRGVPLRCVEWREWWTDPTVLERELQQPCVFKVEPPGDDAAVHLQLLHLGCKRLGRAPCPAPERGELLAVDAWFAGFGVAMQQLHALLERHPHVRVVNAPQEILAMTDKLLCQQRLRECGLLTPALFASVQGYDDLVALLDAHGVDRAFLKARYGSSAAGVVAFRRNGRGREQAITSAQWQEGGRLFNVKRLCRYERSHEVRRVIDLVAAQGAYAEAWVPKPRCGDAHFDLRIVTLAGRAAHRVARLASQPITNLHLDGHRADPAQLLPANDVHLLEETAERASRVFARSGVIGFDVVVRHGAAHVLEANAFGDLLPGLHWQGGDTYTAAFQALEGP